MEKSIEVLSVNNSYGNHHFSQKATVRNIRVCYILPNGFYRHYHHHHHHHNHYHRKKASTAGHRPPPTFAKQTVSIHKINENDC